MKSVQIRQMFGGMPLGPASAQQSMFLATL